MEEVGNREGGRDRTSWVVAQRSTACRKQSPKEPSPGCLDRRSAPPSTAQHRLASLSGPLSRTQCLLTSRNRPRVLGNKFQRRACLPTRETWPGVSAARCSVVRSPGRGRGWGRGRPPQETPRIGLGAPWARRASSGRVRARSQRLVAFLHHVTEAVSEAEALAEAPQRQRRARRRGWGRGQLSTALRVRLVLGRGRQQGRGGGGALVEIQCVAQVQPVGEGVLSEPRGRDGGQRLAVQVVHPRHGGQGRQALAVAAHRVAPRLQERLQRRY